MRSPTPPGDPAQGGSARRSRGASRGRWPPTPPTRPPAAPPVPSLLWRSLPGRRETSWFRPRPGRPPTSPFPVRRRHPVVVVAHSVRRRGIGPPCSTRWARRPRPRQGPPVPRFHQPRRTRRPGLRLGPGFPRGGSGARCTLTSSFGRGSVPPRAGGRVESLASLQRTHPDWFERYYQLHTAVEASAPWGLGFTVPSREAFRRRHVDAGEAHARGDHYRGGGGPVGGPLRDVALR